MNTGKPEVFRIDLSNYDPKNIEPELIIVPLSNNHHTSGFILYYYTNIEQIESKNFENFKLFYNCHSIDYHPVYLACKYLEIIPSDIPFRLNSLFECADIIYFAHWREKKILTILGDEPHISVSILTYDIKHNPNRG